MTYPMNMQKKIKWCRGMEITPATFEAADKYQEGAVQGVRLLAMAGGFGIVPRSTVNVTTTLSDGMVSLNVHTLEAVTPAGVLLQIAGDSVSRRQPGAKGRSCYVVVRPAGDVEQEVNNVYYTTQSYAYDFATLDEIQPDSIPIVKLVMENGVWGVQEHYVPPCMVVGVHPEMVGLLAECRRLAHSIMHTITMRRGVSNPLVLSLLVLDLDMLDYYATPWSFYTIVAKIVQTLATYQFTNVQLPEQPDHQPYNNNDIVSSIIFYLHYLNLYERQVSVEEPVAMPEPEKEQAPVEWWDGVIESGPVRYNR